MKKVQLVIVSCFLMISSISMGQVCSHKQGNQSFSKHTHAEKSQAHEPIASTHCDVIQQVTTQEREALKNPANRLTVLDTETNSIWLYLDNTWHEIATIIPIEEEKGELAIEVPEKSEQEVYAINLTQGNGLTRTFYQSKD